MGNLYRLFQSLMFRSTQCVTFTDGVNEDFLLHMNPNMIYSILTKFVLELFLSMTRIIPYCFRQMDLWNLDAPWRGAPYCTPGDTPNSRQVISGTASKQNFPLNFVPAGRTTSNFVVVLPGNFQQEPRATPSTTFRVFRDNNYWVIIPPS